MTTATNGHQITGTHDEHFDLISILYHSLEGALTYETYCQDAERCGDTELCQFFQEVKEQNRKCAEQAKELLARRLAQQPAMR